MEISSDYCIYSQIWNIPWVIKLNSKQIIYHMLPSIYSPSISLISLTCLQCFKASRLVLWSIAVSHLIAYRYNISPSMALPSERLTTWLIDNIAHSLNFIQSRTGPDPYNSTSSHLCQNKSTSSIYSWLQTLAETSTFQIISLIPIRLREVFLLLSSLFDTAFPFKKGGGGGGSKINIPGVEATQLKHTNQAVSQVSGWQKGKQPDKSVRFHLSFPETRNIKTQESQTSLGGRV